jgi:hypothetical protein
MKILLLAFLLTLGAVLFFAFFAFAPDTLSWEKEIFPKIQNEMVADRADIKKGWENADQWGEEMGSRVRADLKKEFDQLVRSSPTAGKHEPERGG